MNKILLDTNILMIPVLENIDIFAEFEKLFGANYKLFILDKSIDELENIEKQNSGKTKKAAKFAKALINKKVEVIKTDSEDYVDDLLIRSDGEYIIATLDQGVKKKLKKYITLRSKKYLVITEN